MAFTLPVTPPTLLVIHAANHSSLFVHHEANASVHDVFQFHQHGVHDRDEHGGRRRVADPHGQEGRDAHESHHQPDTGTRHVRFTHQKESSLFNNL